MLRTTYLNLKKPEGSDPVNVQDFNDNADTIDTEANARVKSSGGDIANTKVSAFTASTASYPVPAAGETPKVFMGKIKKFFEDFKAFKDSIVTKTMIINQILNDSTKAASAATVYSVNEKVDSAISDLARKHISPTFKAGYSAEGNRGYITISGKTVTLNLGVYSDAGYGAGEVVASIPAEYAPTLTFATGCYIGSAIDKIESVGYAYISTTGDILIADSNFTKRKIARLVVSYQIA